MEQRIEGHASSDYYAPKCVNIFSLQVEHYIGFPCLCFNDFVIMRQVRIQQLASYEERAIGSITYISWKGKESPCVEMVLSVVFKSGMSVCVCLCMCVCLVYTLRAK